MKFSLKVTRNVGFLSAIGAALFLLTAAPQVGAQTLVFDNISNFENGVAGASVTSTSSTPNTFMGDGYNLAPGTTSITGFDVFPVNLTGTTFTGLKITVYVWGSVNTGTVNATTPAFSNLLGTYVFTSTGTYASGFFYAFEGAVPGVTPGLLLNTPLLLPSSPIGVTLNFQGTTDGVNYASVNNLSSLISYGTPATVGSNVFNGYYRNANSETNGNFTSTLRSLGLTNQSVALRVFGTAIPEPGTWALLSVGAVLFFGLPQTVRARRLGGDPGVSCPLFW